MVGSMLKLLIGSQLNDDPVRFDPPLWINIIGVIAAVTTLALVVLIYFSPILAGMFILVGAGAFAKWLQTGYRQPVTRTVLPVYILSIIALLAHGAEQRWSGYAGALQKLFPSLISSTNILSDFSFTAAFSLFGTSIFLFAAATIFYRTKIGGYAAWFLFLWCLVFPLSHFVAPLLSSNGWTYVPGMWTAPFVMALAVLGIKKISSQPTQDGAK